MNRLSRLPAILLGTLLLIGCESEMAKEAENKEVIRYWIEQLDARNIAVYSTSSWPKRLWSISRVGSPEPGSKQSREKKPGMPPSRTHDTRLKIWWRRETRWLFDHVRSHPPG